MAVVPRVTPGGPGTPPVTAQTNTDLPAGLVGLRQIEITEIECLELRLAGLFKNVLTCSDQTTGSLETVRVIGRWLWWYAAKHR